MEPNTLNALKYNNMSLKELQLQELTSASIKGFGVCSKTLDNSNPCSLLVSQTIR